jgi:hypothetical protein
MKNGTTINKKEKWKENFNSSNNKSLSYQSIINPDFDPDNDHASASGFSRPFETFLT